MGDEGELPAWKHLPSTSRFMLTVIEQAIGQGESAQFSKYDFRRRGIPLGSWLATVRRLEQLGFVTVERGSARPRVANRFRLSDRWRELDLIEARRLVRVPRRRAPKVLRLLQQLARAAENGSPEALEKWREMTGKKHVHKLDSENVGIDASHAFAIAGLRIARPDLFVRVRDRVKPKHQYRRNFADDHVVRRLQEGARSRPGR
jgi:hypothetical protein